MLQFQFPTQERFSAFHVSALRTAYQHGAGNLNNRAEEYRRLARECLALASSNFTAQARAALIEMACVWARLADEQDAAMPPIPQPESARPIRPIMQQQQQVQPEDDKKGPGTV